MASMTGVMIYDMNNNKPNHYPAECQLAIFAHLMLEYMHTESTERLDGPISAQLTTSSSSL